MLYRIQTQDIKLRAKVGQIHKQFAPLSLDSRIQITGMPRVILEEVMYFVLKDRPLGHFTVMKNGKSGVCLSMLQVISHKTLAE
jgi:hypothetical protein